jgi:signal transduction histidine kinase
VDILSNKVKDLLYAAFTFAVLLLLGVSVISFLAVKQHEENIGLVVHTQEVLTLSETVYSDIKDAQSAQRGYLLTADTSYLSRYAAAEQEVKRNLFDLKNLTADNADQRRRVEEMDSLVSSAFEYWSRTISLSQHQNQEAAIAFVKKGIGRRLAQQIGALKDDFKQEEQRLLQQRQAEYAQSRAFRNMLEITGGVLAILLLSLAFLALRKLLIKEKQLNASLEQRVEQRTAELHRILDDLKRSNEELDGFVYTASHDLRTPVINLQGLQHVLKRSLQNNTTTKQEEYLHLMDTSIVRLNRTITELADIAKITRENLQPEDLSLKAVLQDVLSDLSPLIERSQARIETDFELDQITYPFAHLRSVLYNLVSNAIKYQAPGRPPLVHIRSFRNAAGKSCLEVRDNGLGLEPKQVDGLFTMYKRHHTHVEGSGVGLTMIKRILENQGGSIDVSSRHGEGSTFMVEL